MDYTHIHHRFITSNGNDPHGTRDSVNYEHHIHCLEIEAYSSMLKAFIAQSDLLTWGKEELLTELRKELHIADSEHGIILTGINSDESITRIREQRKMASHAQEQRKVASHAQNYIQASTHEYPSAPIGNSIIRSKTPYSAAFYPQTNVLRNQVSLRSIHIPSSMPFQPKFNDNLLTAESFHGNAEQPKEMFNYDVQLHPIGRGRVPKGTRQYRQCFHPSESLMSDNKSDVIEIRATDRVIHDVEKMLFSGETPDPVDIERAKQIVNEQEQSLLKAIGKLENMLEGDDDGVLQNLEEDSWRARTDSSC